jgi:hypothetical protein
MSGHGKSCDHLAICHQNFEEGEVAFWAHSVSFVPTFGISADAASGLIESLMALSPLSPFLPCSSASL